MWRLSLVLACMAFAHGAFAEVETKWSSARRLFGLVPAPAGSRHFLGQGKAVATPEMALASSPTVPTAEPKIAKPESTVLTAKPMVAPFQPLFEWADKVAYPDLTKLPSQGTPREYVQSWYDKGTRLVPPVTSWYDSGERLEPRDVRSWYDAGKRLDMSESVRSWYDDGKRLETPESVQSWYDAGHRLVMPVGVWSWYDEGKRLVAADGVRSWYDSGKRLETPDSVRSWYDAGKRLEAPYGGNKILTPPQWVRSWYDDGKRLEKPHGVLSWFDSGKRLKTTEGVRSWYDEGKRLWTPDGERSVDDEGKRLEMPEGVRSWYDEGKRLEMPDGVRSWYDEGKRLKTPESMRSWYDGGKRLTMPDGVRSWYDDGKRLQTPDSVRSWYDAGKRLETPEVLLPVPPDTLPSKFDINKLMVKQVIGKGTQSQVMLGEHPGEIGKVAVKVGMKKNAIAREEPVLLAMSGTPCFPKVYYHAPHSEQNVGGVLVLNLMGPSLNDLWTSDVRLPGESFDAQMLLRIGRGILRPLRELHRQGFVHNDIKPANILLGAGSDVKAKRLHLIDFGSCTQTEASVNKSGHLLPDQQGPIGTLTFASLEADGPRKRRMRPADDIESLVFTLAVLGGVELPWKAKAEAAPYFKHELVTNQFAAKFLTEGMQAPAAAGLQGLLAEVRRVYDSEDPVTYNAESLDYDACMAALGGESWEDAEADADAVSEFALMGALHGRLSEELAEEAAEKSADEIVV